MKCESDCEINRVAGRSVKTRHNFVAWAEPRLEKVLRLEVALVREVVNREIKINPASDAFAHI